MTIPLKEKSMGPRGTQLPDLCWPARASAAAKPAGKEERMPSPEARAEQQQRHVPPPLSYGAPRVERELLAWLNKPAGPSGAAIPGRGDAAKQMQLCARPAEREQARENRHAVARQPILARLTATHVDPTARADDEPDEPTEGHLTVLADACALRNPPQQPRTTTLRRLRPKSPESYW